MPPQTRRQEASAHNDSEHAEIRLELPDHISTSALEGLLGPVNWSAVSSETIVKALELLLVHKEQVDEVIQEWGGVVSQKEADIEQLLHQQESVRTEYNEQVEVLRQELEVSKKQNEELSNGAASLQAQLTALASASSGSSNASAQLKLQLEEREREKKTLTDTLDAALNRETRLHAENSELRGDLQTARKTVSELQAKVAEISSAEQTQKFKVDTLEQQINLLQESNNNLNNELSTQLSRYTELRRQRTEEISSLQARLDQKTNDYDRESDRARILHSTSAELERRLNEALERNRDLQTEALANKRAFQDEMQLCRDLLQKYEKIANEAQERVAEIEKEEEIIRRELTKREESLISQAEREHERAEGAHRKVEELEEVLHRVQTGDLSMVDTSFDKSRLSLTPGPDGMTSLMLSPTASIVSKMQRGGRSITEVYADYVRLQKELQQEKQEKQRLETTLNDIFNEIQDRAPVLTQQRLEYDRVSAEARQLASQLSEAIESRDVQARAAREANHALASKQKEIDILNRQQIDLSLQIRGLTYQLARATDPSLPEDMEESLVDGDNGSAGELTDLVTSELVVFRNIPHLLEQNQNLLKLNRSLTTQLEERDRKAASEEESEMMIEARNVIDSLQTQLQASQAKMEAYIKERDVFKAMAARRQGDKPGDDTSMAVDGRVDYHQRYDEARAELEALKKETARDFEALRAELRQAKADSTEAQVALSRMKATLDHQIARYELLQANSKGQSEESKMLISRTNDLQSQIRRAETKNGELTSTLMEYTSSLLKAQSEVQLLRNEKALQKSREERLEQDNRQLNAERARNNQTLEDYRRMKDELALLWEENKQSLEKERDRLNSDLATLRQELMNDRAAARTRVAEREAEIRDLTHRLTQLNEEVIKSREAAAVAQANQTHLQTRADDLSKQLHRSLEKLAVFERRPGSIGLVTTAAGETDEETLRAQVAELSAELKSVQLELTNERANAAMYQDLAQTTEQALEELRRTTEEFTVKSQQEITLKEAELLSLQEKLSTLQLEKQNIENRRAALEAELETKEAQFAQEKKLLEDIVADVHGADERALRAQQDVHQELLAEAQRTREAQQKYQAILVDHAAVLKERDTLQQQLQELHTSTGRYEEEAKTAQSVLATSQASWNVQSESLKQEVADLQSRYDEIMKQNSNLQQQLASATSQRWLFDELSQNALTAAQSASNDEHEKALQQVIHHLHRDADLLRSQAELLKRENARVNGEVRRLTSELESTRQRLIEERELASKASLSPNDQQALLAKVSENAALIESNRALRNEKATLEERLQKKSDDLIAAESEISPLKQEVITLRSERDFVKVENEALQESVDQWRKRATSIMTRFERIDPEVHEQVKAESERLAAEVAGLKAQLVKADAQVGRWKDAQQQWKNARDDAVEQGKQRQAALVAERDGVVSQLEGVRKELEATKAELQRSQSQNEELSTSATSKPIEDVDATTLNAEISQLKEQNSALQAENADLKAQVTSHQAISTASSVAGSSEQLAKVTKDYQDLQLRARKMAGDMSKMREMITTLQKEKAAPNPAEIETTVAQRLESAAAQAKADQEAAVAAAVEPLKQQLATFSATQPDIAQLQQQHAAEVKSLREQLANGMQTEASPPDLEAVIEQRLVERIAALQSEHAAALAQATENGRKEGEAKFKMLNMQLTKARNEITQLRAAAGQVKPASTPGAGASTSVPQTADASKANGPPITPTAVNTATPIAGAAGLPPTPTNAANRGRGRGVPPATRGAATASPRGRGAAPGVGRGTVLDAVNQAISAAGPSPVAGAQLSILGASGQKRTREDEEATDPGALAKRLKPGEASLPPRPAGRGGAVPINRNRLPGTPGPPA
ncbi:hypothetical protein FRC17_009133 [Serendipita sp. 399]|nr:hypothetical protein FRC17_009133 [Serendipita sp. 399]